MRVSFIDYLACPTCHSELALINGEPEISNHIEEGTLSCRRCPAQYLIRRGIPRFPLASEQGTHKKTFHTQRTYNFTWRRFGQQEIKQDWEKDSYQYTEKIPQSLISGDTKLGLDAGCGGGADLLRLAANGTPIGGVDVSAGVETAYRATHHLANVFIVQADIHHLPFRPHIFDFIYSFGVLHHLPDPATGLHKLVRLLKPDCPLLTYLYEDFSDRSSLERWTLSVVGGIRKFTATLPPGLLYAFCWLLVPFVWALCAVPARLLRRAAPRLAERIPFRHTLKWSVLVSDLFDRFAPPLERRFSHRGVMRLYEQAGLGRIEIHRHRGWVSWGFTPSAPIPKPPETGEVSEESRQ